MFTRRDMGGTRRGKISECRTWSCGRTEDSWEGSCVVGCEDAPLSSHLFQVAVCLSTQQQDEVRARLQTVRSHARMDETVCHRHGP